MITSRLLGALLLPGALAAVITAAGCAQGQGDDRVVGRRDGAVQASARGGEDRPGDSRTGGGNRRDARGQSQYTLAYPTGERDSSLLLLEVASPQQVRVGQPYNYTVRVTNLTDAALHGVQVRDTGTGSPAQSAAEARSDAADRERDARRGEDDDAAAADRPAPDREEAGDRVAWSIGTLGPKQTQTREFTGTADEVGTIRTCLAVSYEPALCIAVRATQPELEVTKAGPSEALICQDITYTYTVRNAGSGSARNIVLEDRLPEGLQTAEGREVVSARIGTLKQGESKNVTARLRAQRTGRFTSRAVAKMEGDTAQSRAVSTIVREPVLAIDIEAPEATYVGQALNYRLTIRNTGDAPAEKTVLRLSGMGGTERLIDRDLGTIAPGGSLNVNVSTRAGNDNQATLNAAVEAVCAEAVSDEATVEIRTIPALQLEVVDGEDPVQVGAETTYTINVRNEGSGAESNIRLRGTLAPEMEFVSAKGVTDVEADGRELTFGPISELDPGAVATWTVVVRATRPADTRFGLELNSDALGRPAVETEPTRIFDPQDPDAGAVPGADAAPGAGRRIEAENPAADRALEQQQRDAESGRTRTPRATDENAPPDTPRR